MGLGEFFVGLRLQPHVMSYNEWLDGSPAAGLKWNANEPSELPEECVVETVTGLNDIPCDDNIHLKKVICQQPIQGKYMMIQCSYNVGMHRITNRP